MLASEKNSSKSNKHKSLAEKFSELPLAERERRIASLDADESVALYYDWLWWARENQRIPQVPFTTWLILAGRGYGKTRVGAETVRHWIKTNRFVNIIAATSDDVRDVCIEGESGILAVCPPHERPHYQPSKRRLLWPNGAKSLLFTADEPERLRGKQHMKVWCDEVAAWRFPESWDQIQFGLRLGVNPQAVVTTTPKPIKIVRELLKDKGTFVTRGTTYENRSNLAAAFYSTIITKYEGTRLGRQELNAELLEDRPGALWTHALIDAHRVSVIPANLRRVGVGVDPATTSNEDSDEWGIITAGVDDQRPPHFYVFADDSEIYSPDAAAKKAILKFNQWDADYIVGETNQGGDMIEATLRHNGFRYKFRAVRASRGKYTRAEPISSLYEQGRVHHVGTFGTLEDQMCDYDPALDEDSPDRMDALVWILTKLAEGMDASGVGDAQRQLAAQERAKREGTPTEVKAAEKKPSMRPKMSKPALPAVVKPAVTAHSESCPQCGSIAVTSIAGGQKRCGQCGKQWGATHTAFTAPPKRTPMSK